MFERLGTRDGPAGRAFDAMDGGATLRSARQSESGGRSGDFFCFKRDLK